MADSLPNTLHECSNHHILLISEIIVNDINKTAKKQINMNDVNKLIITEKFNGQIIANISRKEFCLKAKVYGIPAAKGSKLLTRIKEYKFKDIQPTQAINKVNDNKENEMKCKDENGNKKQQCSKNKVEFSWKDATQITDCNEKHIIYILDNYVLDDLQHKKLNDNKENIINCIKYHGLTGEEIKKLTRKDFGCKMAEYCNDTKLKAVCAKLYKHIIEFDMKRIPITSTSTPITLPIAIDDDIKSISESNNNNNHNHIISIKQCNVDQIVCILKDQLSILNERKCSDRKDSFISYFVNKQIDGKTFSTMSRKQFGNGFAHYNNDRKSMVPAMKIYKALHETDLSIANLYENFDKKEKTNGEPSTTEAVHQNDQIYALSPIAQSDTSYVGNEYGKELKNCSSEQIRYILIECILPELQNSVPMAQNKDLFISFFEQNDKIDGYYLATIGRKAFANAVVQHFNNKKFRGPAVKLYKSFKNFNFNLYKDNNEENCDLYQCNALQRMVDNMLQSNCSSINMDDFLHLLSCHNDNVKEFEYIYEQLGGICDIQNCTMFKRHYRNRDENDKNIEEYTVNAQIKDRIHCFYRHSFDIGHRLPLQQQRIIQQITDDDDSNLLQNKLMKIKEFIRRKQQETTDVFELNTRRSRQHNQLIPPNDDNKENNMYSLGFRFVYGYEDEQEWNDAAISMHPKYVSLKQELTLNTICTISMSQFNNEYEKALVYFNSDYRKQKYGADEANDRSAFTIQILLSLMCYCNFTELQYEFSKTYRQNQGAQHNNFYHMGRNIKQCVHQHGQIVANNVIKTFYHGIGERLSFPRYINSAFFMKGIRIFGPLSTSTSFEVAMNFTNNNNGLIMEFTGNKFNENRFFVSLWLSDFPSEQEHLFIQNTGIYEKLEISNIFDVKFGYEYDNILYALNIIDNITYSHSIKQLINKKVQSLILQIMETQLVGSNNINNASKEYSSAIIQTFFNNKTQFWMNCSLITTKYSFLYDLLCCSQFKQINLGYINKLFPNLSIILIQYVKLCTILLDAIMEHLKSQSISSKLNIIRLEKMDAKSELEIAKAISIYKNEFISIGFDIIGRDDNILLITKFDDIETNNKQNIDKYFESEDLYIGNFYECKGKTKFVYRPITYNHVWTLFISTSKDKLIPPKSIKQVTYYLHPTFEESEVIVSHPPFELTKYGWGYFEVDAIIQFHHHDGCNRKYLHCWHKLCFHHSCAVTPIQQKPSNGLIKTNIVYYPKRYL